MSVRTRRVSGELQRAVSDVLSREQGDVCDGLVTVTGVEASVDLRNAKVFVSVLGGSVPTPAVVKKLNDRMVEIRQGLRGRIYLRYLPVLRFYGDESGDRAARINKLIDEWHEGPHPHENNEPTEEK
jgi:ribosome-binding factor A